MKKILKITGLALGGILLLAFSGVVYLKTALPDVGPPPALEVTPSPELIKRGAYLANSVLVCMDCHSTRDWSKFSGPLIPRTLGKGGDVFNQDFGFPGVFTSKNITPAGVGHWTDGELYRLITTGVTKTGKAIFPVMPYLSYGTLADEDVRAVIAYVRSLEPIENEVAPSVPDFPMGLILNTIPKPANPQPIPDKAEVLAYGKYLTTVAACGDCHTPQEKGEQIEGLYMAGGFEFKLPGFGVVRSANLTPITNGLGSWTEEMFINRFKVYADSSYVPHEVSPGGFQTVMPWTMYATMEEEDLAAIFAYLQSLEPVENPVERFTPQAM